MKKIIISHGEKGGVGKSMIASLIINSLIDAGASDKMLLVEGDTGIPDVAARYSDRVDTVGIPLQRGDLAVEALGELFAMVEQKFDEGKEIIIINLPAGAALTIDEYALELIAPICVAMDASIAVTYAIGPGNESAEAAGKSLERGLSGLADTKIAVINSSLGAPEKMAWRRSEQRQAWLNDGGTELVLPTLTARVADRLHELDGTLTELAMGVTGGLTIVDRMIIKAFIDKSSAIAAGVINE